MSAPRLTAERLAEIKQRADAATPGPWWTRDHGNHPPNTLSGVSIFAPPDARPFKGNLVAFTGTADIYEDGQRDAAFISEARTDVPDLVAEIERLHALIERITPEMVDTVRRIAGVMESTVITRARDEAKLLHALADLLAALRGDA
ncbi:MAG TPA: hypothetical protein VFS44_02305 [Gemmatimonadaceae bacterium]|nr:hypothetical protein [Gemmatimonadaceae bacterium]